MIDRTTLLTDLQRLLMQLQDDLRQRCAERPEVEAPLQQQHQEARAARRTAEPYETWRESMFAQSAVAWILGCVFVRFLEDNELLDNVYLSGPRGRLSQARDYRTNYFQQNPRLSDREFLEHVFREVRQLPGMADLFDERHNPLWSLGLSGDGGLALVEFWHKLDVKTGRLAHDFTDPDWNTRFLGDLYQDLSDEAKKRYALLQTPEFIEEFILDRTLAPAIETFGYQHVRMIDPTCGSAHFLLGGFHRLFALHQHNHPAVEVRALAQRALDQVYGVDLNPNVVAIARFRLLLEALRVSGVDRLRNAPAFRINVGTGDSLLHASGQTYFQGEIGVVRHHYYSEDADLVLQILGQRYHAVVGNPPYIIVKDKALNQLYRERFVSCHRKYSLAAPFMELFFSLAVKAEQDPPTLAGYIGMITANSFMKREFGKKLIEECIPRWDLTHVIDTSGAYIPGHGTPTVILFGRKQPPIAPTIRTVMGIKGEPATPADPAKGSVWRAIVEQADHPGSESLFVSVADTARGVFHKHPWSLGGGGAAELKSLLNETAQVVLHDLLESIGPSCIMGEDEAFTARAGTNHFARLPLELKRPLVEGDDVRDWRLTARMEAAFPYDRAIELRSDSRLLDWLWPMRTVLAARKDFGRTTYAEAGRPYWEYHQIPPERNKASLLLAFSDVATHNHFVLTRGGKLFNRHAPIINLLPNATDGDHLGLLGLLNSSTACFWMKQVFHNKGSTVDQHGARQRTAPFEDFYDYDGTKLRRFPVPTEKPLALAQDLNLLAGDLDAEMPSAVLASPADLPSALRDARLRYDQLLQRAIALQEEVDWECYRIYGLLSESLNHLAASVPGIKLGERAFEIVLARRTIADEAETTWFERHRSTPITQLPAHWPKAYRRLVEKRIRLIEMDHNIRLIEQPEYKRRWNTEPWEEQQTHALRLWLLKRLEVAHYWPRPELITCARLADKLRADAEFIIVADLYRGRPDYDLTELVVELVESEAVPFLPVLRYKSSGLRKRVLWEETWAKQRQEDAVDSRTRLPEGDTNRLSLLDAKALKQQQIGDIPVPPKYEAKDFQETTYWRLRGKLDVPKERFISYPFCGRDIDRTLVIGWAGWNQLQQAEALANYYQKMRMAEGWPDERLLPILAGVFDLLPWLLQWHNELDPDFGMGLGDFYRSFAEAEARRMEKTPDEIRAWVPPEAARPRKRRTPANPRIQQEKATA
jgi:hypothetical protein